MTIKNRPLNRRLSNLQVCAQQAPYGTYEVAKEVVEAIENITDHITLTLRAAGAEVSYNDHLRNLQVALYEYILANNPDRFASAEGFGEHVEGPAGKRVMSQAVRDRDFLAQIRG